MIDKPEQMYIKDIAMCPGCGVQVAFVSLSVGHSELPKTPTIIIRVRTCTGSHHTASQVQEIMEASSLLLPVLGRS